MMRPKSRPVDPTPVMTRGETEFEEARIKCDSTLVTTKIANSCFESFTQSYEYAYRMGFFAGKAAGKRESLGSPTETITSPIEAPVRETAGAQKEKRNGLTTSD
jgi:hypothetical protein